MAALSKAAGLTPKMIKRSGLLAKLTPEEFATLLERTDTREAVDKAFDRELRHLTRERR